MSGSPRPCSTQERKPLEHGGGEGEGAAVVLVQVGEQQTAVAGRHECGMRNYGGVRQVFRVLQQQLPCSQCPCSEECCGRLAPPTASATTVGSSRSPCAAAAAALQPVPLLRGLPRTLGTIDGERPRRWGPARAAAAAALQLLPLLRGLQRTVGKPHGAMMVGSGRFSAQAGTMPSCCLLVASFSAASGTTPPAARSGMPALRSHTSARAQQARTDEHSAPSRRGGCGSCCTPHPESQKHLSGLERPRGPAWTPCPLQLPGRSRGHQGPRGGWLSSITTLLRSRHPCLPAAGAGGPAAAGALYRTGELCTRSRRRCSRQSAHAIARPADVVTPPSQRGRPRPALRCRTVRPPPVGVVPPQGTDGEVRVQQVREHMEHVAILLDLPGDQQHRRRHLAHRLRSVLGVLRRRPADLPSTTR